MNRDTQYAMIKAAQEVEALMPMNPRTRLRGDRMPSLVYMVYYHAARAAYQRAAMECLVQAANAAASAEGSEQIMRMLAFVEANDRTLADLKAMCDPGYNWVGQATIN
jgi:hypothetical protein